MYCDAHEVRSAFRKRKFESGNGKWLNIYFSSQDLFDWPTRSWKRILRAHTVDVEYYLWKDWSHWCMSSNTLDTRRCRCICHFRVHANHGPLSKLVPLGHHRTHAGPLGAPYGLHMGRHGLLRHYWAPNKVGMGGTLIKDSIQRSSYWYNIFNVQQAAYPPPRFVLDHKFPMND